VSVSLTGFSIRLDQRPEAPRFTYLGTARDSWGNVRAGFETSVTLNRKDFGLT
jgi:polyisoprenoid-binding protein YceI